MVAFNQIFAAVTIVSLTLPVQGCGAKEEAETPQTLGDIRAGKGIKAGESQEVQELNTVHSKLVPGSLILGGANLTNGDNPCANSDGFFDCQPEMLKLYVKLSKDIVGMVTDIYANLDTNILPNLPVGNGTLDIKDDSQDITKLHYNIIDENKFDLLAETSVGPAIHFAVLRTDSNVSYTLRHDGTKSADEDSDANQVEVKITYRSATDFTVDFLMKNTKCDPSDLRSPQKINIKSNLADGVWTGKTQMYMPLWLFQESDNVTCNTEATDATKMFFYTDFVGNDDLTTASIYFADKGLTDTADIDAYAASDFCDNFSSFCFNGYGFGDPNPVASYSNPFCVAGAETTWGSACTDLGVDLYSSASNWDLPAAYEARGVEIPASLAAAE